MKAFQNAVTLRMVRRSMMVSDAQALCKTLPLPGREGGAPVGGDVLWHTEPGNPSGQEGLNGGDGVG